MSTECTSDWPGNGGLRVRSYDSMDEAEDEAKALCDAMTLKHAAYNTGFTGAKLVFDSKVDVNHLDKEQLMDEVARTLASEGGRVYTGCDINTTDGYAASRHRWLIHANPCTPRATRIFDRLACVMSSDASCRGSFLLL